MSPAFLLYNPCAPNFYSQHIVDSYKVYSLCVLHFSCHNFCKQWLVEIYKARWLCNLHFCYPDCCLRYTRRAQVYMQVPIVSSEPTLRLVFHMTPPHKGRQSSTCSGTWLPSAAVGSTACSHALLGSLFLQAGQRRHLIPKGYGAPLQLSIQPVSKPAKCCHVLGPDALAPQPGSAGHRLHGPVCCDRLLHSVEAA